MTDGVQDLLDRDALRRLVERHRWSFPVAQDRDGILANLYAVAVCPQIRAMAGPRRGTPLGAGDRRTLDPRTLDRCIDAIVRASRRAGWTAAR